MTSLADLSATFTTSQARDARVQFRDLYSARDSGELVELSRGVFRKADAPAPTYPDLLAVAYRAPQAVVCLVSAAAVHDLTDEVPLAVQIAVAKGSWRPQIVYPPTQVFAWNPATVTLDIELIEAAPGETVRIYSPARTVVDLLRLRSRIGEPVALVALRRYLARRDAPRGPPPRPRRNPRRPRPGQLGRRSADRLMSRPTRADPSGRAFLDLQNLARRQGRPTQALLVMYVLERFLARMAAGPHADRFVLKGGMLLAAWNARRATADADLLARALTLDAGQVLTTIVQIAASASPHEDGVDYLTDTTTTAAIRDGDQYGGIRITMHTRVAAADVKLQLDISTGDPVTPAPQRITFPTLRTVHPDVHLLGYPLATVLAEKLCTAVDLGSGNSRVRDYADLWTLTSTQNLDATDVTAALTATARHRGITLHTLSEAIYRSTGPAYAEARASTYTAYRRRLGPDADRIPRTSPPSSTTSSPSPTHSSPYHPSTPGIGTQPAEPGTDPGRAGRPGHAASAPPLPTPAGARVLARHQPGS